MFKFFYHLLVVECPHHLTSHNHWNCIPFWANNNSPGPQPPHHCWAPTNLTTTWPQSPHQPWPQLPHLSYSPTNAPPLGPNHPTKPFPNHPTTHHTWPQPTTTCGTQWTYHILVTITPPPLCTNSPITHHTWPQPTHHFEPNHPTTSGHQSP